jgi:hypothetical protein
LPSRQVEAPEGAGGARRAAAEPQIIAGGRTSVLARSADDGTRRTGPAGSRRAGISAISTHGMSRSAPPERAVSPPSLARALGKDARPHWEYSVSRQIDHQ